MTCQYVHHLVGFCSSTFLIVMHGGHVVSVRWVESVHSGAVAVSIPDFHVPPGSCRSPRESSVS